MNQEQFIKLFKDAVFVSLDESGKKMPLHTRNLSEVLERNIQAPWGAYFSVNGFAHFGPSQGRTRTLVSSLNAYYIDIDVVPEKRDEIHKTLTQKTTEMGIPLTASVITGKGVHGYWVFKEPILNPSEEQKKKYEVIQESLVRTFRGDLQARDIPRILRIPFSRYWKNGTGEVMELRTMAEYRYTESDFARFIPRPEVVSRQKTYTPITDVVFVRQGERHKQSYVLALKICNQFNDPSLKSVAHAAYRAIVDSTYEKVPGDHFHDAGGEADRQFEAAWEFVQNNPLRKRMSEGVETQTQFTPALSFDELFNAEFPEANWAIDKLFESNTINMISAPPNHGKSWFVLEAAIACAQGTMLFDRFKTTKQNVMIVNEEDNPRQIQSRLKILLDGKDVAGLPIHFHIQKDFKLKPHDVDRLLSDAEEKSVKMIIFDSLRSVHDGDENSSQETQQAMNEFKKFIRKGITVLFTHHNRKRAPFGSNNTPDGEESRGSSAINAAVHGHLSLNENSEPENRFILVRQPKIKGAEKLKPFKLVITPPWKTTYSEHDGAERSDTRNENQLLEILQEESDVWFSVDDLAGLAECGASKVRQYIKSLVRKGYVLESERKHITLNQYLTKSSSNSKNQKLYKAFPEQWPGEEEPTVD